MHPITETTPMHGKWLYWAFNSDCIVLTLVGTVLFFATNRFQRNLSPEYEPALFPSVGRIRFSSCVKLSLES